jgi:hypothetical protein
MMKFIVSLLLCHMSPNLTFPLPISHTHMLFIGSFSQGHSLPSPCADRMLVGAIEDAQHTNVLGEVECRQQLGGDEEVLRRSARGTGTLHHCREKERERGRGREREGGRFEI